MRRLGLVFGTAVIFLATILTFGQNCQAENTIIVSATVPAISTVVVSKNGLILKIIANSSKPQSVDIRLGSVNGAAISPSSKIMKQYSKLTDNGRSVRPGLIYAINLHKKANHKDQKNSLVAIMLRGSNYRTIATISP